jgi:GTP:adenosylcobinamide-phosphate guanylyltransferase
MTSINFRALVLAGSRPGPDPVARAAGLPAKALVPVAGRPMLLRVLSALAGAETVGHSEVVGLPPAADELRTRLAELQVTLREGRETPSQSVAAALAVMSPGPVLVTTADHALLRSDIVDAFTRRAYAASADVVIGLVRYELVRQVCPATRRTVMHFRAGGYCGCNLFAFLSPAGRQAVGFWTRIEQRRKQPAHIARALGLVTLIRYFLRRLTLEDAMARLSRLCGARVIAVELPFGEAAIDVDKPEDLVVAEALAAQREPAA